MNKNNVLKITKTMREKESMFLNFNDHFLGLDFHCDVDDVT
jgi:hypothetical protein